jgi:methyl-accepting chemotaxis protein
LAIVAIVGITSLNKAKVGFRDYRSLAQQTNEAGRVQANLLTARLHVKNYVINSSQTSIDQVQERAKSTLDLLNGLDVLTADHPEMQKIVQTAASEVKTYVPRSNQTTKAAEYTCRQQT